jgi:hypothetical protein
MANPGRLQPFHGSRFHELKRKSKTQSNGAALRDGDSQANPFRFVRHIPSRPK